MSDTRDERREPKRWESDGLILEAENGPLVDWHDYDALARENEELRTAVVRRICSMDDPVVVCPNCDLKRGTQHKGESCPRCERDRLLERVRELLNIYPGSLFLLKSELRAALADEPSEELVDPTSSIRGNCFACTWDRGRLIQPCPKHIEPSEEPT